MTNVLEILHTTGIGAGYVGVALLCLAGLLVSCLSLSGTWLVVLASALAAWLSGADFPGLWTVIAFAAISGLIELAEFFAGSWGVTRRGGSGLAGFMALLGGIGGLFMGTIIPIPLIGSLIGMMIGSFALVFLVEYLRLERGGHAAHIAWGTVIARVLMIMLKVGATLGMIAYLFVGLVVR